MSDRFWIKQKDAKRLYELVNGFMAELGMEGEIEICTDSELADDMMTVLYDIDEGCPRVGE